MLSVPGNLILALLTMPPSDINISAKKSGFNNSRDPFLVC
jgi:hypothetical protein